MAGKKARSKSGSKKSENWPDQLSQWAAMAYLRCRALGDSSRVLQNVPFDTTDADYIAKLPGIMGHDRPFLQPLDPAVTLEDSLTLLMAMSTAIVSAPEHAPRLISLSQRLLVYVQQQLAFDPKTDPSIPPIEIPAPGDDQTTTPATKPSSKTGVKKKTKSRFF